MTNSTSIKALELSLLCYFILILLTIFFYHASFILFYPSNEAKAEIQIHPVIVEAKVRTCTI